MIREKLGSHLFAKQCLVTLTVSGLPMHTHRRARATCSTIRARPQILEGPHYAVNLDRRHYAQCKNSRTTTP
ncbi:hypothetical protein PC118_g16590 [Phytophthora cactorum]|uniref:Uncharacterized protein n=1 Tax=Phytophthora cactorum TaxID=29920 RepID=A0A8T1FDZ2_9STRA|nr:hypothetical protein PC118_g16590 [Phytophthora cactorum]